MTGFKKKACNQGSAKAKKSFERETIDLVSLFYQ